MSAIQDALKSLALMDGKVTSQIIADLIAEHAPTAARQRTLYERYKASQTGVPIFSRKFEDTNKVNNKLNNDFFGEIIDTKIGYFLGKPIVYDTKDVDTATTTVTDFNTRNNVEDLDAETGKMAATCGMAVRLLYIDKDAKERVMEVDPWECIFVSDRSLNESQFALRYYPITVIEDKKEVTRNRVEWYDDVNITFYMENKDGEYVLDITEAKNPMPHLFSSIPLIAFVNNDELQADGEKAIALIDGYDRTLSDMNSEIEQFRLAYMAFYGTEPTEETITAARQTGAFGLPDTESKIEFITKTIDDTIIENHLNRLEDNILRFGKSVNFNDEAFAGNLSGVAMKFKLFGLETKCITAERKFISALRKQYQLLAEGPWSTKGMAFDWTLLKYQFTRNFPLNLLDEAQTTVQLKGQVSESTRLSLLSFIDDPEKELKAMQEEATNSVDLDSITGNSKLQSIMDMMAAGASQEEITAAMQQMMGGVTE